MFNNKPTYNIAVNKKKEREKNLKPYLTYKRRVLMKELDTIEIQNLSNVGF